MIKAVLFDLWNTLVFDDSKYHPLENFANKIGKTMTDRTYLKLYEKIFMTSQIASFEEPTRQILRELNITHDEKLVKELLDILNAWEAVTLYPETITVLKALKLKKKIGLISNTENIAWDLLKRDFNMQIFFDAIVLSCDMASAKPDPIMFETALKRLGVTKDEAIMVGDSLKDDVQAAESFGIKGVLVDRKNKYPEYPNRVTSLVDIKKFLD